MSRTAEVKKADPSKHVHYLSSSSVQHICLSTPGALSQLDEDDLNPHSHQKGWTCPQPLVNVPCQRLGSHKHLAAQIHKLMHNWKLTLKNKVADWKQIQVSAQLPVSQCWQRERRTKRLADKGQQWLVQRQHRLRWTWPVSKRHPEIHPYIAHEAPAPRDVSLLHPLLHNVCFWNSQEPKPREVGDRAPSSTCLSP